MSKEKGKMFTWIDEVTALLLKVALDNKTTKLSEGKDWETVRSKYEDLTKNFLEHYPLEESEEFPRGKVLKENFTKERLNSKLKRT